MPRTNLCANLSACCASVRDGIAEWVGSSSIGIFFFPPAEHVSSLSRLGYASFRNDWDPDKPGKWSRVLDADQAVLDGSRRERGEENGAALTGAAAAWDGHSVEDLVVGELPIGEKRSRQIERLLGRIDTIAELKGHALHVEFAKLAGDVELPAIPEPSHDRSCCAVPSRALLSASVMVGVPTLAIYLGTSTDGVLDTGQDMSFAVFAGIVSALTNGWLSSKSTEDTIYEFAEDVLMPLYRAMRNCDISGLRFSHFLQLGLMYGLIGIGIATSASMFTAFKRATNDLFGEGTYEGSGLIQALNFWFFVAQYIFTTKDFAKLILSWTDYIGLTGGDAGASAAAAEVITKLKDPAVSSEVKMKLLLMWAALPNSTKAELADPCSVFNTGVRAMASFADLPWYARAIGYPVVLAGFVLPTAQAAYAAIEVFNNQSGFVSGYTILGLDHDALGTAILRCAVLPLYAPMVPRGIYNFGKGIYDLVDFGIFDVLLGGAFWREEDDRGKDRLARFLRGVGKTAVVSLQGYITYLTIYALLQQAASGGEINGPGWFGNAVRLSGDLAIPGTQAILVNSTAAFALVGRILYGLHNGLAMLLGIPADDDMAGAISRSSRCQPKLSNSTSGEGTGLLAGARRITDGGTLGSSGSDDSADEVVESRKDSSQDPLLGVLLHKVNVESKRAYTQVGLKAVMARLAQADEAEHSADCV